MVSTIPEKYDDRAAGACPVFFVFTVQCSLIFLSEVLSSLLTLSLDEQCDLMHQYQQIQMSTSTSHPVVYISDSEDEDSTEMSPTVISSASKSGGSTQMEVKFSYRTPQASPTRGMVTPVNSPSHHPHRVASSTPVIPSTPSRRHRLGIATTDIASPGHGLSSPRVATPSTPTRHH
jgi:hypothetical protein